MQCSNDIDQLYDTLGMVINIFDGTNEQNGKEKLERISSIALNVDEESKTMLKDGKKSFKEVRKSNDELRLVDEYFHSSIPIIHQSPFNKEAIRRLPILSDLIKNKSKNKKIDNPLFSPSTIRIIYRCWAYLPLWTGKSTDINDERSKIPIEFDLNMYSHSPIPNSSSSANDGIQ
ncbi:unnamed protein product [Rotaria sp. Silwood2]|nr:unnamed protein product [Rotaria sp. Silwood2]CAF3020949.1 unnamed protein product [Rotaria sp. Silwood2]CAF3403863.1 unnamed protein product [Rotaria sp. Silwood2]CAF4216042.1 unnamed protein product [Rotaria sp. Silwood2]CAF4304000.1 unnamed protein product [Rotaria sp. Silwood2]